VALIYSLPYGPATFTFDGPRYQECLQSCEGGTALWIAKEKVAIEVVNTVCTLLFTSCLHDMTGDLTTADAHVKRDNKATCRYYLFFRRSTQHTPF
jgi:hypothetical protein